ncbi:MAG: DUF2125 domain-containing protein [Sulfitobacter sp.]
MRRLMSLIVILLVIWCAWWMAASTALHRSIVSWIEDRQNMGWQAEVSEVSKQGFPLALHSRLRELSIADPVTGVALATPQLDLVAAAYWPGFMSVKLPDAPIDIKTPAGGFILQTSDAQFVLHLRPVTTLQLQGMRVTSGPWQLDFARDRALSADDLHIDVIQDEIGLETYRFDVNATNLTPGTLPRSILALPMDWPASFDTFAADLEVKFDIPWDRNALSDRRPQPRHVTLHKVDASWGSLQILASGEVAIDTSGVLSGAVSTTISNWRDIVDLVETSGALSTSERQQVEIMLSALANLEGSPDNLDLNLTFKNGEMSVGPIYLGPAPQVFFP